ncbi:hypothetical protein Btru_026360 [Bulinus truncatus]|nr:hypothetical protein Btru_026360 [Bulinus truncatus]
MLIEHVTNDHMHLVSVYFGCSATPMACYPCVHHIEIGVVDGLGTVEIFKLQYDFKVVAYRKSLVADQWLLVSNNTRFLITSLKTSDGDLLKADDYVINWSHTASHSQPPTKDSVFNIAFQVKDIDAFIQRLENHGTSFVKPLRTVSEPAAGGCVRTCVVKSCVGDVYHTLIEKSDYNGDFLPGFTSVANGDGPESDHQPHTSLMSFDHAALAVEMKTSMSVIGWYEKCFGMKRFLINREEEMDEGLVLSTNNVGLRLRAMEYWKCAEVGLLTTETEGTTGRLSMVIAEGLPPYPGNNEENQIESWLRQHGGPGIQHVAINTPDIKSTVQSLRQCGATFAKSPPDSYYSEIGRLHDIVRSGEDVDGLRENGILIDTEANGLHKVTFEQMGVDRTKSSYLLQIFTRPLLQRDPFFLELIQREGATGFGSGNVAALYRSVQAYIVNRSNLENKYRGRRLRCNVIKIKNTYKIEQKKYESLMLRSEHRQYKIV